ncbi:GNAT family N-acetyltransferase [Vreelandella arcis]|uniref:Acetyltransferase (GNAT) family protein n=1 Tax=Vreelandella arcis TaxID=416873 RepID=A0A1H0I635_9GAMM|nr:GNAT family N-acetyltransferase [Halomonas arcis]SDO26872.1 Acetyltransferase (GNAT) family protein [Halomonas arcis]
MKPNLVNDSSAAEVSVISCPQNVRREAVLQLKAARNEWGRDELVVAINLMLEQSDADWSGLLITPDEEGNPIGATWVEVLTSKEANLWLPHSECGYTPELLSAATGWARQQGLSVVKTVLEGNDLQTATLLKENGVPKVASLNYMGVSTQTVLKAPVANELVSFMHVEELAPERLEIVFGQIEENSLDCPELQGMFTAQEALQGFYRQDVHAPAHWYLVRYEGEDAGVLLLAPHPESSNWELMYMGLVPAWRGRGLGIQVVNEAIHRAREAGMEEVILAVDERNTPARQLYEQFGFRSRLTCVVHAWMQKSEKPQETL